MTQTQLFVSTEIDEILTSPTSQPNPVPAEPNREPVLILVIGSQKGIDKIVSALYLRRFAAVQEWSQILYHFFKVMTDFCKLRKWHSYNVLSCSNSTGSLEKWYYLPRLSASSCGV